MRRGRLEIIGDILAAAKEPSTKTSIVYSANLSFSQAERYLNLLLEEDLIKSIEKSNIKYEITEKGKEFLKGYKELDYLLSKK